MYENSLEPKVIEAIQKQEPHLVQTIELGGDYYFKCPWMTCNTDVSRFDNYCRKCGQRLEFPLRL